MAYLNEKVVNNRNNTIDVQLTEDGVPLPDHSVITRIQLVFSGGPSQAPIDSADNPTWFDLTNIDRVYFKLGSAGLAVGRYWMTLMVYDAINTDGVEWEPKIRLTVV